MRYRCRSGAARANAAVAALPDAMIGNLDQCPQMDLRPDRGGAELVGGRKQRFDRPGVLLGQPGENLFVLETEHVSIVRCQLSFASCSLLVVGCFLFIFSFSSQFARRLNDN